MRFRAFQAMPCRGEKTPSRRLRIDIACRQRAASRGAQPRCGDQVSRSPGARARFAGRQLRGARHARLGHRHEPSPGRDHGAPGLDPHDLSGRGLAAARLATTPEQPKLLVAAQGPRPGRRVTATDPAIDLRHVPAPVDAGLVVPDQPLMGGPGLVLGCVDGPALRDRGDGLGDGLEPQRVQLVEVETRRGVLGVDRDRALLHDDGARVHTGVRPEDADAGVGRPQHDLPGQGIASPEGRQQRGMEAQGALGRAVDDLRWQDRRDEGEHVQIDRELAVLLHELGDRLALAAEAACGAGAGRPRGLGLLGQGIRALPLRRCVDRRGLVAGLERAAIRDVPGEGRLSEERDAESHPRDR